MIYVIHCISDGAEISTDANEKVVMDATQNHAEMTDDDLREFIAMEVGSFLHMSPYECILCDAVMHNDEEMHEHLGLHSYELL